MLAGGRGKPEYSLENIGFVQRRIDAQPDRQLQGRITRWFRELGYDPRPDGAMPLDESDLSFSCFIPSTDIAVSWTIDEPQKLIRVLGMGPFGDYDEFEIAP